MAALPIMTEVMVAEKHDKTSPIDAQRRQGRGGFLTGCIGLRVSTRRLSLNPKSGGAHGFLGPTR
ncbi:MAG: hypothetical protein WB611_18290 [Stellaceae bacterium]